MASLTAMSYADIDFATVPAAPPARKNQRATSCPAPISAIVPYQRRSRLICRAFCRVSAPASMRALPSRAAPGVAASLAAGTPGQQPWERRAGRGRDEVPLGLGRRPPPTQLQSQALLAPRDGRGVVRREAGAQQQGEPAQQRLGGAAPPVVG